MKAWDDNDHSITVWLDRLRIVIIAMHKKILRNAYKASGDILSITNDKRN